MWTGGLRCYAWSHDCTHAYHFTRCRERRHKVRFRNLHSNLRSAWPPFFLGPYELQKNENKKNPTKPKINPTNVQASGRSGWLFSSSLNQRRRYIIVFTQHEEFRGRGGGKKEKERERKRKEDKSTGKLQEESDTSSSQSCLSQNHQQCSVSSLQFR